MNSNTKPSNALKLPNGIIIRPRNIRRVVPYGPDFRDTGNTGQVSETWWIKLVEANAEYTVKLKDKGERDSLISELLSQLSQ